MDASLEAHNCAAKQIIRSEETNALELGESKAYAARLALYHGKV